MALLNNKNKANGKMHAYAKSRFSHDTGISCISIFFGKTNIFTRKAQKKTTTGPDSSVNFNKSYKLHFDKNQRFEGNSLDPDRNTLSADSSASTLFANSAFLCLPLYNL